MEISNDVGQLGLLSDEVRLVELGDKRLNRRLGQIMDALALRSEESFPEAMRSDSALEAFYRILRNDRVSFDKILEPHLKASSERAIKEREILCVHDTTEFAFRGLEWRKDVGWVGGTKKRGPEYQGFFGHFALALSASAGFEPLGIIGFKSINRTEHPKGRPMTYANRKARTESLRWGELVNDVETRLNRRAQIIHVMDREGDMYELLAKMRAKGERFVIRINHNRTLVEEGKESPKRGGPKLYPAMEKATMVVEREVAISRRGKDNRGKQSQKKHPPREARTARLAISAMSVLAKRTERVPASVSKFIQLNVVRVWEPEPPAGEQPIEWKLFTSEPIETPEQLLRIIDIYRARWVIEEYFKALKTGCQYEKRQLESLRTLQNALAILVPVAWRILLLRHLSRTKPDQDARIVFTKTELEVLRYAYARPFSAAPTVREAVHAIASLAGHHKSNGPPGWQILWRGYQDLRRMEHFWVGGKRCDR